MILTLKKLITKAKSTTDPREAHALALDLVESMLRHYAVVAIAAYRHAGACNQTINQTIVKQLERPSMGSWKNFLQMLAHTDKDLFPAIDGVRDKLARLGVACFAQSFNDTLAELLDLGSQQSTRFARSTPLSNIEAACIAAVKAVDHQRLLHSEVTFLNQVAQDAQ